MYIIMLILAAGIVTGYVFRRRPRVAGTADRVTTWVIYLLLFTLGLSIGADREIMGQLGTLGLEGLVLAVCGLLGSTVCAWIVWRLWFRGRE